MLKIFLCMIASTLLFSLFNAPVSAKPNDKDKDWVRSKKEDDIEIYYQAEKVGSDNYEVKIKVVNNRSKTIRVLTRIQNTNKRNSIIPEPIFAPSGPFTKNVKIFKDGCELIVPAQSSTICEGIKVMREKINGVDMIRWINEDLAQEEDKRRGGILLPPGSKKPKN